MNSLKERLVNGLSGCMTWNMLVPSVTNAVSSGSDAELVLDETWFRPGRKKATMGGSGASTPADAVRNWSASPPRRLMAEVCAAMFQKAKPSGTSLYVLKLIFNPSLGQGYAFHAPGKL